MISHEDVALAHQRAMQLDEAVQAAQKNADDPQASVFTRAYAEALRQQAQEAMVTAAAQARWTSWRPAGSPISNLPPSQVEAMCAPSARADSNAAVQEQDAVQWDVPSAVEIGAGLKGVNRSGIVRIPILGRVT